MIFRARLHDPIEDLRVRHDVRDLELLDNGYLRIEHMDGLLQLVPPSRITSLYVAPPSP